MCPHITCFDSQKGTFTRMFIFRSSLGVHVGSECRLVVLQNYELKSWRFAIFPVYGSQSEKSTRTDNSQYSPDPVTFGLHLRLTWRWQYEGMAFRNIDKNYIYKFNILRKSFFLSPLPTYDILFLPFVTCVLASRLCIWQTTANICENKHRSNVVAQAQEHQRKFQDFMLGQRA